MALVVVLDANVLYSVALTDFFLTLADHGVYRPHWNREILHEAERNILRDRPDLTRAQLSYRFDEMNDSHPGALVNPDASQVRAAENHEKDRHVLATAIATGASVIATFNLKDFPPAACRGHGIEAQHPDTLAYYLVRSYPGAADSALQAMSLRTRRPHLSVAEIVERLRRDLPTAMLRLAPTLQEQTARLDAPSATG